MRYYQLSDTDKRRDVRKSFGGHLIPVECKTIEGNFNGQVKNVSASGVFIETDKPLETGKEIALTFRFPASGRKVMATGEVVRTDISGVGVSIKILFRK
jgi:Tfp pilus assembly protein PilZ